MIDLLKLLKDYTMVKNGIIVPQSNKKKLTLKPCVPSSLIINMAISPAIRMCVLSCHFFTFTTRRRDLDTRLLWLTTKSVKVYNSELRQAQSSAQVQR